MGQEKLKFPHKYVIGKMKPWFLACTAIWALVFIVFWLGYDFQTGVVSSFSVLFLLVILTMLAYIFAAVSWHTHPVNPVIKPIDWEKMRRQTAIENFLLSWYVRYPFALALIGLVMWMAGVAKTNLDWLAVGAISLVVLLAAYEFFIFLLIVGILAALWLFMTGLSVQGAIICGALIIAFAIYNALKRDRDE